MPTHSMIDLAILGLLTEQELHGYELKKRLGELLPGRSTISFGSLYPALARLEKHGNVKAVEERTEVRPVAPMSGSLAGELAAFRARVRESSLGKATGRSKKVYGITDLGRERLQDLLTDPDVSDDRAFSLRVAFARHLPDQARLELFERRRTELLTRRDDLRRRQNERSDTYLGALRERDADHLVHDLAWLDRLIDAERTQLQSQEEPTQ